MKVIESHATQQGRLAIVQTASTNGGRQGSWVNLRLVHFAGDVWAQMQKGEIKRLVSTQGVDIVESEEVDARNQGPRSGYGKALARLRSNPEFKRAQFNAQVNAMEPAAVAKDESRSLSMGR